MVFLDGEFELAARREQLLNVLLSAFEDLIHINQRHEEELAQRRGAEEALAQERNLLRTLIDNLPDHVYIKDAQGRYILGNRSHQRFLGLPAPIEGQNKTVFDLFPRHVATVFADADKQVVQSGQPLLDREEPIVDRTGAERWLSTSKAPLFGNGGQVVGVVGISRDVTDRRKAQEELVHERSCSTRCWTTAPTPSTSRMRPAALFASTRPWRNASGCKTRPRPWAKPTSTSSARNTPSKPSRRSRR